MPTTFTTPLMNLVLPTVGPSGQVGPTYATNLNVALERVDAHNHTSGNGQPLTQGAFNITGDLELNGNDLIEVAATLYESKALVTAQLSAVYVVGGNLYFNNSAGVAIQITAGSGINLTSLGTIGGDYSTSTASVIYTDATKLFLFKQSPTQTANLACGPIFIYENTVASNFTKIENPVGLAANRTITLPASFPGSTLPMKLSASGAMSISQIVTADITDANVTLAKMAVASVGTANIVDAAVTTVKILDANVTTAKIADGAVTPAKRAALGQQISAGSGLYTITNSSTTYIDVTNLSVTITTTGRPIFVGLIADVAEPNGQIFTSSSARLRFVRGSTDLGSYPMDVNGVPASTYSTVDVVAAGTYTYKLQTANSSGGSITRTVNGAKLVVYEL